MARRRTTKKAPKLKSDKLSEIDLRTLAYAAGTYINQAAEIVELLNERWWRNPKTGRFMRRNFGELIALGHSELSEALEADRKDLMDDKLPHRRGVEVELADEIIRVLDTARNYHRTKRKHKLNIGEATMEKLIFNHTRPDHKPKARLAKGGKAY
jgi:hypothetical protein